MEVPMFRLRRYLLPILILPAAACSAAAGDPMVAAAPMPTSCEIRVTDTPLGWQVEPLVRSATALSGVYDFRVAKVSRGGMAVSSQGGDFSAAPGKPTVLGTSVFDRTGSIEADLTVRWSGGAVSCERRFPGA